ncbi:OmpA family protein [Muricoccus pecuniae]|uniref:Outer membrane protein OmpA-like peptidoglycan-associated protein n=1 Tax=Muricoccus pecuniae TaxID=693023 RepID=A0A840Y3Q4_9PROT|nr:OmpA family protein [Roseomonas pecuniae]MBB5694796.1 outer membrane protein OmpA-like peptidoglycan-associated protein [Roseomonas pecuniae]
MSLKKALLAATIMSLPLAAQAQPVTGVYIAAGAGFNWLQSTNDGVEGPAGTALGVVGARTKTNFETGWVGVGSIGYGFGNGLRLEAEGSYRENDVADFRFGNVNPAGQGGRARTYGAMGNVLFDLALPGIPVVPYIGGGVGYQWHEYDSVRGTAFGPGAASRSLTVDDRDGSFAYQGIAGVALNLGVPGLALTAEYRFLGTLGHELDANLGTRTVAANPATQTNARGRLDVDNYNHSVLIGLRYAFNAPRPAPVVAVAPAPAAAPAPARTYLVFFDFDRADLTDRARQIIGEAAQAVNSTGTTRLEVAGHADRSGTPQYNQRLSQRRAEAVAAELARRGISRNQISVQAFGESRPLVPTADGVREPQNRRVEIVLR